MWRSLRTMGDVRVPFNSHARPPLPSLLSQDAAKAMARDEEGDSETRSAPPVPEHFRVWASANASYAQPAGTRLFFCRFASNCSPLTRFSSPSAAGGKPNEEKRPQAGSRGGRGGRGGSSGGSQGRGRGTGANTAALVNDRRQQHTAAAPAEAPVQPAGEAFARHGALDQAGCGNDMILHLRLLSLAAPQSQWKEAKTPEGKAYYYHVVTRGA